MATPFTSISVSDTTSTNNLTANSISTNAITLNTTDLYVGSAIHCDNLLNNVSNITVASNSINIGNAPSQTINMIGQVGSNITLLNDNTGLIFSSDNSKIYKKIGEGFSMETSTLKLRDATGTYTALTVNTPSTAIQGTTITNVGAVCINKTTNTSGYYLDVNGAIINNSTIRTTAATASTSTSTGALQVAGGAGIGGAVYIGGLLNTVGSVTIQSNNTSISPSTGALVVTGGVGVGGPLYVGPSGLTTTGPIATTSGTASTNTSTGAIIVSGAGGVGVGGNVNVGGTIATTSTTASTSTTTGALVVAGGVGIAGALNVGGSLSAGSISITNPTIGYLTVNPALGQPSLNTHIGFFTRVSGAVTVTSVAGRVMRDVITLTTLPAGVWRFDVTFNWTRSGGILNTGAPVMCAVSNTSGFDPYTDTTYARSGGRAFWDDNGTSTMLWGGTYSFSVIDSSATAVNWYITATGGNTTTASGSYTYTVGCTVSRVA